MVLARGRRSRLDFGRIVGKCDMTTAEERKAAWIEVRAEAYERLLRRPSLPAEPAPAPVQWRTLTDSQAARIEHMLAEDRVLANARQEAVGQALGIERRRYRKRIEEQQAKIDELALHIDALQAEISKLERGQGGDRNGEIIELPPTQWVRVVRDRGDAVRAIAADLMARATIAGMRDDAAELVELCEERPIPPLAPDVKGLALDLMGLLVRERARSRRLIELFGGE